MKFSTKLKYNRLQRDQEMLENLLEIGAALGIVGIFLAIII